MAKTTTMKKVVVRAKPYSRTEVLPDLPRGVKLPKGYTAAYFRKRKSLAVLRAADRSHYLVFNTATGQSLQVSSTEEASKTMSAIRRGLKSFAA